MGSITGRSPTQNGLLSGTSWVEQLLTDRSLSSSGQASRFKSAVQTALLIHAFSARPRGQYGRDWGKTRARPRRYPRFSRFASGLTTTKLTGPCEITPVFGIKVVLAIYIPIIRKRIDQIATD